MAKSEFAKAVDSIQASIRPLLKAAGYRVRGRTFNRVTEDQLTQVVNFQMGPSDPPAMTYHPGLRENLHGTFTVNLGVYVPEVARFQSTEARSWVQDYHCCVRSRLAETLGATVDIWWRAANEEDVIEDVAMQIKRGGLPFLERFASRDSILEEWSGLSEIQSTASAPPRIVLAIIHAVRGETDEASKLLAAQVSDARQSGHIGHAEYVTKLALELGLPELPA